VGTPVTSVQPSQRPRPSLTRRASLNALAAFIDHAARVVIQLVLAPLMLRFLGDVGYGIWQVLQRLIGQAAPAGGRPGEALKWVVAQAQASEDGAAKRERVGTAIAVWLLFLPLVAVLGGGLAWVAPALVQAPETQTWLVRGAAALLVLNLMVLGAANIPQSVLLGENLGYRRLGTSTAVLFVGAILTAGALWLGWGLIGVALAMLMTTALSGVTYLQIVRSQIPWWGARRPTPGAVRAFVGISWWFLLWNLVMQAMRGSDVIVLAVAGGVALVTTYTLTSYVPNAINDLVFTVISATMPGLGGLVGAGDLPRAARIRGETMVLSWMMAAGAATTALVWLPDFLALWVGARFDAGTTATVLICVMVMQLALIRVDSNVIDLTLRVRAKVLLGLFSVGLSVTLAVVLVGPADLGIIGLVTGFLAGRLPLTVAYPILVGRLLDVPFRAQLHGVWRPALTFAAMVAAATWARGPAEATSWGALIGLTCGTAVLSLGIAYCGGFSARQRSLFRARLLKVVRH
jgi:O-antigen/teichoic acid export membrane protein